MHAQATFSSFIKAITGYDGGNDLVCMYEVGRCVHSLFFFFSLFRGFIDLYIVWVHEMYINPAMDRRACACACYVNNTVWTLCSYSEILPMGHISKDS